MGVNPAFDCAGCKQPGTEFFSDKRYKQSVCRSCFIERRSAAAKALDSDWFLANIPFDQFTEDERLRTGIETIEEYNRALAPAEADGTENDRGSTKKFR